MSVSVELQKAIFVKLSASTELSDIIGTRLLDHVPDNYDVFPFVTIGEDVLTNWDDDTQNGFDVSVTIHVWSRYPGRKETKEIQGIIYSQLHQQDLTITGYNHVLTNQTNQTTTLDPDGKTYHGVQELNVLLHEV